MSLELVTNNERKGICFPNVTSDKMEIIVNNVNLALHYFSDNKEMGFLIAAMCGYYIGLGKTQEEISEIMEKQFFNKPTLKPVK